MSGESSRHKHNRGKVFPGDEEKFVNPGYEMESVLDEKDNRKLLNKFKTIAKFKTHMSSRDNPLNLIANLKQGAQRWRKYVNKKRKSQNSGNPDCDRRRTGGDGLDKEVDAIGYDEVDASITSTQKQNVVAQNRNLIEYFRVLGNATNDDTINLEYVDLLLKNGARIDCTDKYGQTVLHEASRCWHVDVAKFLIEHGANINQGDNFGRTPLHIAAAVDYPEMVNFLISYKADKEANTKGEHQTPVHYAARNDACLSLKALIKAGCEYKLVRDYKGRTPLHVAAELDRSETAALLMEVDDPAPAGVVDNSGQSAIVWMITKMPPVAKLALDQFHTTDRANRKQYFHLQCLEPRKPDDVRPVFPQQALPVMVIYSRLDLVTHPVVMKLINLKWRRFGRMGALLNSLLNFIFIMLWTLQGVLVDYDQRYRYDLPDDWWRILLFALALVSTAWQVKEELSEFFHSRKIHQNWKRWRESEIEKDLSHSHPRWPEEELYLRQEIGNLDEMRPQYFNDFWNIFDWICYALLLTVILTHVIDVIDHSETVARLHIRIMAVNVILLWLRLMKNMRAFARMGPFIVMISHMINDVISFALLYLEFFIPFACAFWMLFGGDQVPSDYQGLPGASNYTIVVDGFGTLDALMFSLFRMTLVDEYAYSEMKAIDSTMTDLLVGTWLALSAIVMLNLLIALMSDTFQRVYDNAQANAIMQKAITILNIEEGLSHKRRRKFRDYIHTHCNPWVEFYDDDATDSAGQDLKKVTIKIKDQLDVIEETLGIHFKSATQKSTASDGTSGVVQERFELEMNKIRDDIQSVQERQRDLSHRFKREMSTVKQLLMQIINTQGGYSTGGAAISQSGGETGLQHKSSFPGVSTRDSFIDEEWEKVDRKRRKELKKLREQLNQDGHQSSVVEVEVPNPSSVITSMSSDEEDGKDEVDLKPRKRPKSAHSGSIKM